MGAAGFAAVPLVAGVAAGCTHYGAATGFDSDRAGQSAERAHHSDHGDQSPHPGLAGGVQHRAGLPDDDRQAVRAGQQPRRHDHPHPTAHDQGVTFFDTAEAYGPFESERIVGEALEPVRDQVVIASKFGFDIDPQTGQRRGGPNSRPDHIRAAVDAMLQRLRTDRIDLLYQHRVDPTVPIEDVAGTVKDLIAQGKVRHFGLSEPGLETVRRAHAVQPLTAIQNEYSMLWRGPRRRSCRCVTNSASGSCPGRHWAWGSPPEPSRPITRFAEGDFRAAVPRNSPENLAANMPLVQLISDWGCARAPPRPRSHWPG